MSAPPRGPEPVAPAEPPTQVTLPAGAWIKLRVDQPLSSDHSMAGEGFTATLTQPVVADGLVVARRGQTIAGRVTDAVKAGRAKGTSRLGIEFTELSLVDGRQLPIRTQLIQYQGGTSKGRDATAIATTTGVGAAIGAAADGGFGAGMGAIAGAVASTIGVLVTRGHATVIDPETELTLRLEQPVVINISGTQSAAFHSVQQSDYERTALVKRPAPVVAPAYPPYWGGGWGGWGPGWYGPGYFGPSVVVYRGYYGGGWHGGRRW